MSDYPQGSRHRLFLAQPTQENGHLWHASLAWGEMDDDPWNPDSPNRIQRGGSVTGTVTRYVGNYAALVRLDDSGIEAFLHRAETPEEQADIRHSLHIGDRVQAFVMAEGTDFERLRVNISVNEAIESTKRAFFERYHAHKSREVAQEAQRHEAWLTSPGATDEPPFIGKRLLVVEHDTNYARQQMFCCATAHAGDERIDLRFTPRERAVFLTNMRAMLGSVQDVMRTKFASKILLIDFDSHRVP